MNNPSITGTVFWISDPAKTAKLPFDKTTLGISIASPIEYEPPDNILADRWKPTNPAFFVDLPYNNTTFLQKYPNLIKKTVILLNCMLDGSKDNNGKLYQTLKANSLRLPINSLQNINHIEYIGKVDHVDEEWIYLTQKKSTKGPTKPKDPNRYALVYNNRYPVLNIEDNLFVSGPLISTIKGLAILGVNMSVCENEQYIPR